MRGKYSVNLLSSRFDLRSPPTQMSILLHNPASNAKPHSTAGAAGAYASLLSEGKSIPLATPLVRRRVRAGMCSKVSYTQVLPAGSGGPA